MKLLDSPRRRWYLLAVLWVALIVIGVGGFLQQTAEGDLDRSRLDNVYLTLQLATLDYAGGTEALNWRLNVARFVAPMMAAGTLLQAASLVFREQFLRWRLRFFRSHIVICGLGAAGSRLAITLKSAGHRVVAVEPDATARGFGVLAEHDIATFVGDPTDAAVLRAARVDRAARLVAISDGDATNVTVATAARQVVRSTRTPALRCSVHLTDAELTALLRGSDLGGDETVRLEFFNLHELAARALLTEHPPFTDAGGGPSAREVRRPHLVVLGLGQLGRSLVVAAAQQWADIGDGPLPMTLVDRFASGRWHALRLQHLALTDAVEVQCLDLDLEAPTGDTVDTFTTMLVDSPPSWIAVTFEDESLALASGLLVRRTVRRADAQVVVRTDADSGLGAVVSTPKEEESSPSAAIALFPFLDRACSPSVIEGGVREQLARAIHGDHITRAGSGAALHRPWEQLSDEERESSRRAADGIVDGLSELGFELLPLQRWGLSAKPLADKDVEHLAAREHARWKAEREAAGWRHGPARDDAAKLNPLLVGWTEAPDHAKAFNRDAIRAMPSMLARAGFELVKVHR